MDNNSVENQTNENKSKNNRRIAVCCCIVAAICIVAATVLVMHFRNSDETAVVDTGETEEKNDSGRQDNETTAETEISKPEFEISDDGVLTAYNGEAETVVIPDNVISIGADAFGTSPYAEDIKTVKLGKSVEDIDVRAFVSLKSLEDIEVVEDNNNYNKISDGILLSKDGTIFLGVKSRSENEAITAFIDKVYKGEVKSDSFNRFIIGPAVIEIEFKEANYNISEVYPENEENKIMYFTSVSAYGQKTTFDESLASYGNVSYRAFDTDEGYVFSKTYYVFGSTWILTKNGVLEYSVLPSWEYNSSNNDSVIFFSEGENGELIYSRRPRKFCFVGGCWDYIYSCTGLDEFAREEGIAKVENGDIVYYPEKTYTAREIGLNEDFFKREFNLNSDEELQNWFELNEKNFGSAK